MQLHPSLIILVFSFFFSCPLHAGKRWTDFPDAVRVLGHPDFVSSGSGTGATSLSSPWGIAVDPATGKVFVADFQNHRVLRYASYASLTNGAPAESVLGQPDFTSNTPGLSSSAFDSPQGVFVDGAGRLWVSDANNARILRFDGAAALGDFPAASAVLGQPDFITNSAATSISKLRLPRGLVVDAAGNLFVADVTASRVLMYADAATLGNGADAALVLGQNDFTTFSAAISANRMNSPNALALDAAGNLYVADRGNHRVLRYDGAAGLTNGANADGVFGQADFVTKVTSTSATGMNGPIDLRVDSDGVLWVAEFTNTRVIGFENPASVGTGATPVRVIGQADFTTNISVAAVNRFGAPAGLALDGLGRLYVTDFAVHRILIFEKDHHQPDFTIGEKIGSQRGANLYNRTGAGQKKPVKTAGKEVKFVGLLGNDGNIPDTYLVRSDRTDAKYTIKVFALTGGKRNITAAAKVGTHQSGTVLAGGAQTYEMRVKPKSKFRAKRATNKAWIEAASMTDGELDRVIGEVKNRP